MRNVVLIVNNFNPFTVNHIRLIKNSRNLGDVVVVLEDKNIDTIEILKELRGIYKIEIGETLEDMYWKYKDEGIIYYVNPEKEEDKKYCKSKGIEMVEVTTDPFTLKDILFGASDNET